MATNKTTSVNNGAKSAHKVTGIAIYSLGLLFGLLHVFIGTIALTPLINADYHREIALNYNGFASRLLGVYEFTDKASLAFYLRWLLSSAQVVLGVLLIENGHYKSYDKIGNYGLIILDAVLLCFQLSVGTAYGRVAPTVVFLILLVTRLLLVEQQSRKSRVGMKTRNAGKVKTSTPKKNKND